jgi:2-polyprenyl-3-methyl-5-hydroxy-6-metoxy-1,4-benzoquinol methylase
MSEPVTGVTFYDRIEGTHLREYVNDPHHSSYYFYRAYIALMELPLNRIDHDAPILDLGCGDGRFTLWLLAKGFTDIHALDSSSSNLKRLRAAIPTKQQGNVTTYHWEIMNSSFKSELFDAVLAIETLCFIAKPYHEILAHITPWIKPNGLLIGAEPALEGHILKHILNRNFAQAERTLETNTSLACHGVDTTPIQVFTKNLLLGAITASDLHAIDITGISSLPTLVSPEERENNVALLGLLTGRLFHPYENLYYIAIKPPHK